jgi:hypothetical protein
MLVKKQNSVGKNRSIIRFLMVFNAVLSETAYQAIVFQIEQRDGSSSEKCRKGFLHRH